jgi:hypothetical protein
MPTLDSVVHADPKILGGTPVFRGTRVPVKNLVDYSWPYEPDRIAGAPDPGLAVKGGVPDDVEIQRRPSGMPGLSPIYRITSSARSSSD